MYTKLMARTKQKIKLQKRDWAIIVLLVIVISTNWSLYQAAKTNELQQRNNTSALLIHQVQINKLKDCIDKNISPCDTAPYVE